MAQPSVKPISPQSRQGRQSSATGNSSNNAQTVNLRQGDDAQIAAMRQLNNAVLTFIDVESQILASENRSMLQHNCVNLARKITMYGHGIFVERTQNPLRHEHAWKVKTVSGLSIIDGTSPFIKWVQDQVSTALHPSSERSNTNASHVFEATQSPEDGSKQPAVAYPYTQFVFVPVGEDAGMVFTRDVPWPQECVQRLERFALATTTAWQALGRKGKSKPVSIRLRWMRRVAIIALVLVLLWPVSMTTLAPAEIRAQDPAILAAPINGVIEKMHVAPSTLVKQGDVIATYVDTTLRNEFEVASREVAVAQERFDTMMRVSFGDPASKRELKILQSEINLARNKRDYAADKLAKATLTAQSDGIVIYPDQEEWAGRPVATGERIATIANPANVHLKLEAPANDGEILKPGAKVKLFLDANPVNAILAELKTADYYAEPVAESGIAYLAIATLDTDKTPRIGARGVAKIYGPKAPFGFWLLRRPIVSIRQSLGI